MTVDLWYYELAPLTGVLEFELNAFRYQLDGPDSGLGANRKGDIIKRHHILHNVEVDASAFGYIVKEVYYQPIVVRLIVDRDSKGTRTTVSHNRIRQYYVDGVAKQELDPTRSILRVLRKNRVREVDPPASHCDSRADGLPRGRCVQVRAKASIGTVEMR